MKNGFKFAVDRGGTFTDIIAILPDNSVKTMKLLSEDPANYKDAPTEGIKRILCEFLGSEAIDKDGLINTAQIEWIRMGTTGNFLDYVMQLLFHYRISLSSCHERSPRTQRRKCCVDC
jgi:Hydantoinase/oxoprolinase N-terminal region